MTKNFVSRAAVFAASLLLSVAAFAAGGGDLQQAGTDLVGAVNHLALLLWLTRDPARPAHAARPQHRSPRGRGEQPR